MIRFLLLFSLLSSLWASGQRLPGIWPLPPAQREVRAVWFCTLGGMDWPGRQYAQTEYKAELQRDLLRQEFDRLQALGINTILFQTRIRSTVAYPSAYEPWDGAFSGTPGVAPPYDVLQFAIDEAHRRGMELHAYLVAYPICSVAQERQLGRQALPRRRPDLCMKCGDKWMMDPGVPATSHYIAELCREIVSRYEVDGIHLDYIRYPEKEIPFNDARTYARYGRGQDKAQWRRDNVTRTVKAVHDAVRPLRPWIKLSCSPIGKYSDLPRQSSRGWNALDAVQQDAQLWLREGWMDMLFPMMYFDGEHFYPFLADWLQHAHQRLIVPGLGTYLLSPSEKNWEAVKITRQMNSTRQVGAAGQAHFRSRFLLDNHKGISTYAQRFYAQPALPPAMTWLDSIAPAAPQWRKAISGRQLHFSWPPVTDETPITYNLYRLNPQGPQLLAHHLRDTTFTLSPALPALLHAQYAVVAMDAYGNESSIPPYDESSPLARPFAWGYPDTRRSASGR